MSSIKCRQKCKSYLCHAGYAVCSGSTSEHTRLGHQGDSGHDFSGGRADHSPEGGVLNPKQFYHSAVCLPACLLVCLSVCLPACLLACLPARPPVCLSVCLSVRSSVCLSVCLSVCQQIIRKTLLSVLSLPACLICMKHTDQHASLLFLLHSFPCAHNSLTCASVSSCMSSCVSCQGVHGCGNGSFAARRVK